MLFALPNLQAWLERCRTNCMHFEHAISGIKEEILKNINLNVEFLE